MASGKTRSPWTAPKPTTEEQSAAAAPPEEGKKLDPPSPNWVRARALKTCLVRGKAEAAGAEFWIDLEQAMRLEKLGHLKLI